MSVRTGTARFSYVVPYRGGAEQAREANLRAVLRWLAGMADVEVVLVEQDAAPTLQAGTLPPNCTHVFAPNPGPFNKSWGFNVGFRRSSGAAIAFGDADMLMNPQALLHCLGACGSEFEAMKPYDRLIDLTREESRCVLDGDASLKVTRSAAQAGREGIGEYVCFCGGVFVIRRETYERLGGFDERFVGWGGEDDAMTAKLTRLVANPRVLANQAAFHLWHARSAETRQGQPHYRQNVALLEQYGACDLTELQAICARDRQTMGDIGRYAAT